MLERLVPIRALKLSSMWLGYAWIGGRLGASDAAVMGSCKEESRQRQTHEWCL